jgi:steroid delta-isomerase-like uncharacterized protein
METVEQRNIRLILEHFTAESAHDHAATLETVSEEIEYRMVPLGWVMRGKEEVNRYYDLWWSAFPDVSIKVDRINAAGEWVIAECTATSTHSGPFLGIPPTGRKVTNHVCCVIRVRDGKMVEETVYYDQMERLTQIGSAITVDGHPLEMPQLAAAR